MFEKARKQYIVLRKMKLSGCDPQLYFAFMRIQNNLLVIKGKNKERANLEKSNNFLKIIRKTLSKQKCFDKIIKNVNA